ncbi:TPA: hypothetical protein ACTYSZ_003825 [Klebsiella aerogenes]
MTSKLTREQATDTEIQMLIDSHEKGTAMFMRTDAYYFMAKELQERRKTAEPELNRANLANKFYERYPLATFKSDSERAEAFGYFMAGAELQCFGEFIKYEDLCGDE